MTPPFAGHRLVEMLLAQSVDALAESRKGEGFVQDFNLGIALGYWQAANLAAGVPMWPTFGEFKAQVYAAMDVAERGQAVAA